MFEYKSWLFCCFFDFSCCRTYGGCCLCCRSEISNYIFIFISLFSFIFIYTGVFLFVSLLTFCSRFVFILFCYHFRVSIFLPLVVSNSYCVLFYSLQFYSLFHFYLSTLSPIFSFTTSHSCLCSHISLLSSSSSLPYLRFLIMCKISQIYFQKLLPTAEKAWRRTMDLHSPLLFSYVREQFLRQLVEKLPGHGVDVRTWMVP